MSYNNRLLVKPYSVGAAVNPYRIVKFGADARHVIQATAATDILLGVSNELPANTAEDLTDVALCGIAEVELGNTVTLGAQITADSVGRGVVAAPAAGVSNFVIGIAMLAGVVGDIIPVMIGQRQIQGLPPVTSVAGRTGAVTLTHADLTDWSTATTGFLNA